MPHRNALTRTVAAAASIAAMTACSSSTSGSGSTAGTRAPASASSSASSSSSSSSSVTSSASSPAGPSSGAADVPAVDPCTVLDGADVVAAGGRAGQHSPSSFDGGPGCDYGVVSVYWIESDSYFTYGDQTPLSGLGDQAFYSSNLHYVRARKGTAKFEVQCVACQGDERPVLTTLAQKVLARLP